MCETFMLVYMVSTNVVHCAQSTQIFMVSAVVDNIIVYVCMTFYIIVEIMVYIAILFSFSRVVHVLELTILLFGFLFHFLSDKLRIIDNAINIWLCSHSLMLATLLSI